MTDTLTILVQGSGDVGEEDIPLPVRYVIGKTDRMPTKEQWDGLLQTEYRVFYLLNPNVLARHAIIRAVGLNEEAEIPDYVVTWLSQIHKDDVMNRNLRGYARAVVLYNKLHELYSAVSRTNGHESNTVIAGAVNYLLAMISYLRGETK